MRTPVLVLSVLFAGSAMASDYDMKSSMQQMKLDFKYAAQAQTVDEMQLAMESFALQLSELQEASYAAEKQSLYREGFNKLSVSLDRISQELHKGDLEAAKQQLKVIDQLREEYHDKRNPSIWSKLFG